MGNRNRNRTSNEKKPARLVVKRETLRQLRSLTDDQLRAAAGGWGTGLPSCHRC